MYRASISLLVLVFVKNSTIDVELVQHDHLVMLWTVSFDWPAVPPCTHHRAPDSLWILVNYCVELAAGLPIVVWYVWAFLSFPFVFSFCLKASGWCLEGMGGLGPSPTLLAGRSLPNHPAWRASSGGCRSQDCCGSPSRSALAFMAPPSFQAPSTSSSIVNEFKCG